MLNPCVLLKMTKGYQAQLVSCVMAKNPNTQVSPVMERKASHTRIITFKFDFFMFDLFLKSFQSRIVTIMKRRRLIAKDRASGSTNSATSEWRWLIQQFPTLPSLVTPYSTSPVWPKFSPMVRQVITRGRPQPIST